MLIFSKIVTCPTANFSLLSLGLIENGYRLLKTLGHILFSIGIGRCAELLFRKNQSIQFFPAETKIDHGLYCYCPKAEPGPSPDHYIDYSRV